MFRTVTVAERTKRLSVKKWPLALEPLWFWWLYPECLLCSDEGRNQTGLSGHEKILRKMSQHTRVFNIDHEETGWGVAGRICKVERGLKTAFLLKKKIVHYWSECNWLGKESHWKDMFEWVGAWKVNWKKFFVKVWKNHDLDERMWYWP